jgi:nucleoside-diphosphate-sugar epimerase
MVTGDRGYLGAVLAPSLAAAGHAVEGLDTDFYAGCDLGAPPTGESRRVDIRTVRAADLEGFDAVVHLAALSNDPLGDLSEELTYAINLEGTLAVARAARDAGVRRFVFASSCSMYGASDSDEVLNEDAPLRPLTAYAASKVRAEEALSALADDDFWPVAMRNATVYGASPRLRLDIVLNNLAAWAHTTGRIRLLSDGMSWRPLVHVQDVALVTARLLEAPAELVQGTAYNIGSEAQNYLVRDLAEVVADVTGCEIEVSNEATADPRSYRVDFSRLRAAFPDLELGWSAERGARELIEAYRGFGLTEQDFAGSRFVRLRRIRELLDSGEVDAELRSPHAETGSGPTPQRR